MDQIAKRQLLVKRYKDAEESYKRALSILINNKSYDQDTIKKFSASIYHQLGMVAQEQRQWEQAKQYYQQTLQLSIEYNDHYTQARTYHQLGILAQKQRQWEQAEQYYQQAFQIYIEYNDSLRAGWYLPPVGRGSAGAAAVGASGAVLPASLADLHRVQRPLLTGLDLPPVGHGGPEAAAVGAGTGLLLTFIGDRYGF